MEEAVLLRRSAGAGARLGLLLPLSARAGCQADRALPFPCPTAAPRQVYDELNERLGGGHSLRKGRGLTLVDAAPEPSGGGARRASIAAQCFAACSVAAAGLRPSSRRCSRAGGGGPAFPPQSSCCFAAPTAVCWPHPLPALPPASCPQAAGSPASLAAAAGGRRALRRQRLLPCRACTCTEAWGWARRC